MSILPSTVNATLIIFVRGKSPQIMISVSIWVRAWLTKKCEEINIERWSADDEDIIVFIDLNLEKELREE